VHFVFGIMLDKWSLLCGFSSWQAWCIHQWDTGRWTRLLQNYRAQK